MPHTNPADTTPTAEPTAAPEPAGHLTHADSLAVEARVRAAYRDLDRATRDWTGWGATPRGAGIDLADLRAALPDLPSAEVDAALRMLAGHADVHLWPASDQEHASDRDRAAAVWFGNQHHHRIAIDKVADPDMVAQRLRATNRARATSMVASLDDTTIAEVADRLGVAPGDGVRHRLVESSVAAQDAWLADGRQGEQDGRLLHRADTEPDWVAGFTDADRDQVRQAAQRLRERAHREPSWAYIRGRATRWAQPSPSDTPSTAAAAGAPSQQSAVDLARRAGPHQPPDGTAAPRIGPPPTDTTTATATQTPPPSRRR